MLTNLSTSKSRILIVDDEPGINSLLKDMLTAFDYDTVGIENPLEALELFRDEHERIDLVLTDLTMPHMSGLQLAKELYAIDPSKPIYVLTGYSESHAPQLLQEECVTGVLEKPIIAGQLFETLDNALKKRSELVS